MPRIAVIGTGLIGASVGLAARRQGAAVSGFDADAATLALAAELGAVEPADSLARAVRDAEIAVVAAPVATLPRLVEDVLAAAPEATVTDVGSTKSAVCSAVRDARFI